MRVTECTLISVFNRRATKRRKKKTLKKKTKGPSVKIRPLGLCLADRGVTLVCISNIIQLNVIANNFTRIHSRVMNFCC